MILSKFDALRVLRDVEGSEWSLIMSNAGAAYLRDTSDAQYYDEAGGQLLHEEVRSLLTRLNAAIDGGGGRKPFHRKAIGAPVLRGVLARAAAQR